MKRFFKPQSLLVVKHDHPYFKHTQDCLQCGLTLYQQYNIGDQSLACEHTLDKVLLGFHCPNWIQDCIPKHICDSNHTHSLMSIQSEHLGNANLL